MKIFIGADHAGYELKKKLKVYLSGFGHEVEDKGAFTLDPNDDYPDFVRLVAEAVATEEGSFGIVMGASGQGEHIAANRVKGVRAVEYYARNLEIIKLAREQNNANILSLGARFLSEEEVKEAVKMFLATKFENEERHQRRIKKLG